MADQRITELTELSQVGVASNDVLPIADVSASQTKKVQVKSLIQAGFNLADSSTLDISKINQTSATKFTGVAVAANTLTYDKIQQVSANKLLGRQGTSGDVEEINCTVYARTLLNNANAADARTTLELGIVATGDTVSTALLENNSVTTDKINDLAVTTAKIAESGVTTGKLANGAVTGAKIETSGITGANIAASAISGVHFVDSGITLNKMAANSVSTVQLVDSGITYAKLAANAISGAVIADSGITTGKLASGVVQTINLADSGITNVKIASGTITADRLNLGAQTISGSVITASSIPSGAYAASSIVTADIADNAVTFAKIQQVASDVLLGRASAGSGNIEAITLTTAGRALLDDADASEQRATLGLGSIAVQSASGVAITGGTAILSSGTVDYITINGGVISGITDLEIADGGTGASTASGARTNLGLVIGSDVQAYSPALDSIAGLTTASGQIIYTTAADTYAVSTVTSAGLALLDDVSASAQRATLGLGTLAVQNTVGSGNFDAGAIVAADIASDAVTTAKIIDSGVTTAKIADNAITAAKLGNDAVTTAKIIDSGVTTAKLADAAVSYAKIQQVSANKLLGRQAASGNVEEIDCTVYARTLLDDASAADARTTLELGIVATGNTISTALIENEAVTGIKIAAGAISGSVIADSGIPSGKLASAAVQTANIENGSITGIKIASGVITVDKLSLASGSISGSVIASGTIPSEAYAPGAVLTTSLANNAVTFAKIQQIATDTLLGRATAGTGEVETIALTSAGRALLADASASAQRTTLGLGSLAVKSTVGSGDYDAGSVVTASIADDAVTTSKIQNNAVTYAKIQQTATSDVLLGRSSASGGTIEEVPCTAAARSILDDATIADIRATLGLGTLATQNGISSGTNTGDQIITLSGDVTGTGASGFTTTIANSAVTTAKINDSAVTTVKIIDSGVTAIKLADNSAAIVAGSSPVGSGTFIGQQWFNTSTGIEYTWTGSDWTRQTGLSTATISGDTVYDFTTLYPDSFTAQITPTLKTQVASRFFAGPASGSADAVPTFRTIAAGDLPKATGSELGVAQAGTGLIAVSGVFNHANSVASGVYYKVTVDGQGHVSAGASGLTADDIPALPASKITTGTIGSGLIADDAVLASKLADYSVSRFGEVPPTADFIGQFFYNPLEKDLYLWDGNVWNPVGISVGEVIFAGTYNASSNLVATTSADGAAAGLSVGQPLPAASSTFNRYYVVVASGGTGTSPAPTTTLQPPDILLCNGTAWTEVDVSSTYTSQSAINISFTPGASISASNVQAAIEEVSNECRNVNNVGSGILDEAYGGTGQNSYAKGDLLVASGSTVLAKLAVGTNGQVLTADSAEDRGMKWVTPASGTVLSVSVNAPLTVVSGTTTPVISIPDATTSVKGVVQLTDSTSTTSSTVAATATAVKSAYDLANAALPKAGGIITGEVVIGNAGTLLFEGATDNNFEIQLTAADATSDKVITLPDVTGTLITTGDNGTVTNTMLAGSISDTKLSTISTALKVSNSATTATSANTANAIVARDASGNFSAGTIDATIDEGSY